MKYLRTVDDVMTHAVISVDRLTAFKDIAEALRMWDVSALPVIAEDRRVAGVSSGGTRRFPTPGAGRSR
ncbi:CBS domain-containing protein [Streptomyces sp. NPDC056682]|uniref:CBS domain-containing protein n=1 Tax=Streptomyces sp. NPDC056682 TaxID=3345909 RepID=UPI0036AACD51